MQVRKKEVHQTRTSGTHYVKSSLVLALSILVSSQTALAQNTGPATPPPMMDVLARMVPMFIIVFGIFYFLVIRPQKQELQDQSKLLEGLKKGDRVVTSGGIIGQVVGVEEQIVILGLEQNARMKVEKRSIARKLD
jgi:preprotein translocase subunit YajC